MLSSIVHAVKLYHCGWQTEGAKTLKQVLESLEAMGSSCV